MDSWLEIYEQLMAGKVIKNKGSQLLFSIQHNKVVLKEEGDTDWTYTRAEVNMLRDVPEMYELYELYVEPDK
jgi:hypothetical protein